jgi:cytochrome c553
MTQIQHQVLRPLESKMKAISVTLAIAVAAFGTACSNLERSRDLANPAVPARVMAAQVCSNCHGLDGNSVSPAFPRLAGQQAVYIVNQLKGFRSQGRSDPAGNEYMWGLSHHLTDEQIAGLADYYSKQTSRRTDAPAADPKLVADGKEIFEKGVPAQNVIACISCHGPKAQGVDAFPRLAHQHAYYIERQLDIFQNTQGRPGTPMEAVTHPLTGANKAAIAAYLQAFPD